MRRGSDIRKYLHLKFLAIKEIASSNNYSIKFLCEILKVNRKSYYKWLKRIPSKREKENEIIKEKILEIHNRVEGIYSSRRMTMNINRELDKKYSCKRIYRLKKEEVISSYIRFYNEKKLQKI
ncbi:IS3 family transposase [uncultured Fusobacterium sp.]|uniref:IS3 family transposase n=1 Tax=uncultured Fusobacterium sp. TaxID=159267 RepID=UPI00345C1F02